MSIIDRIRAADPSGVTGAVEVAILLVVGAVVVFGPELAPEQIAYLIAAAAAVEGVLTSWESRDKERVLGELREALNAGDYGFDDMDFGAFEVIDSGLDDDGGA